MTGAAIEIPLLALTVWALARLGVGNPDVELMRIVRFTAVFAGVAALLTAGGIGRLAAYVFAEPAAAQGAAPGAAQSAADESIDLGRRRRRAILRAARAHAAAGAGLVLIAAIPHGRLPEAPIGWLAFGGAGLVCGAVAGAIIGFVCSSQTAIVHLSDVWSLARRPRVALRSLLDPEDLVRLGSALRARTTNLFEGIFEPAPLPPKAPGAAEPKPAEPKQPARDDRPTARDPAAEEATPPGARNDA